MSKKPDYIQKLSQKLKDRMKEKADQVSEKIKPTIIAGDASDVPTQVWHEIIRQKWNDPAWRAKQANARGKAKFVQEALEAFGYKPSLLRDNAEVIVYKLPQWKTEASQDKEWLAKNNLGSKQNVPMLADGAPVDTSKLGVS